MPAALECLVYGKVIVDDIRLADGAIVRGVLGGGGPQAAFGARLWSASVGLFSRVGADLAAAHRATLEGLAVDLAGGARYPDLPTMRGPLMAYDERDYRIDRRGEPARAIVEREDWRRLLARPLALPPRYRAPRAVHLITEFADEPMVETALGLRARGALLPLEPLLDVRAWSNRDAILALLPRVDLVTPDWPSASGVAGSDDPARVLAHWARLGPRLVAIRYGRHGSYVRDGERDRGWHVPAVPVAEVDPTGTGNAYGGGLCTGWLAAGDAREAGARAAVAASFLVERVGPPAFSGDAEATARERLRHALAATRPL